MALEGALVARPGFHQQAGGAPLHRATLTALELGRMQAAILGLDLAFFFCTDRWRIRAHHALARHLRQLHVWDPYVDFATAPLDGEALEAFVCHLVGPPEQVAEAGRRIQALDLPDAQTIQWEFWDGMDQLQVRQAGIGKHTGLARVPVAPAHARPQVRALAHHVLPGTCEDDAVPPFLAEALRAL
ncbi:MAG: hypothetical protein AB1505_27910 [Candidatus Latescibacterota bacterium]